MTRRPNYSYYSSLAKAARQSIDEKTCIPEEFIYGDDVYLCDPIVVRKVGGFIPREPAVVSLVPDDAKEVTP